MSVKRSNGGFGGGATTSVESPCQWDDHPRRCGGVVTSSTVEEHDEELVALGVYDPGVAHADLQLELLHLVNGLGATPEELVTFRDTLPALAGVLAIRGRSALTLEQVARTVGTHR